MRTPRLGPFVSSSEDSLHQPERASNSSVQPEGLRIPVGGPVGNSVLRQHHHSSVCPSPAGSRSTGPQWPAVIRLSATSLTARLPVYYYRPPIRG